MYGARYALVSMYVGMYHAYIDDHGGVRLRVLLECLQAVRLTKLSSPRTRAWQGQEKYK